MQANGPRHVCYTSRLLLMAHLKHVFIVVAGSSEAHFS